MCPGHRMGFGNLSRFAEQEPGGRGCSPALIRGATSAGPLGPWSIWLRSWFHRGGVQAGAEGGPPPPPAGSYDGLGETKPLASALGLS